MNFLFRFRQCIFLLLSFTLSAQAMAVISLGACHRAKVMTTVQASAPSGAHHHAEAAAHPHTSMHHADSTGKAPVADDARQSCAACAACHMASIIPNDVMILLGPLVATAAIFPNTDVPRARNVANGLERPPRA